MIAKNVKKVDLAVSMIASQRPSLRERLRTIPWWLVAIFGLALLTTWAVTTQPAYAQCPSATSKPVSA